MMVAFHTGTLGVRGSENALGDYAELNERILGNRSVLVIPNRPGLEDNETFVRWRGRFPVLVYWNRPDLVQKLHEYGVEVLYMIKPGYYDGLVVPGVRNCIHSMFLSDEFHGDRFAYVSPWAARVMTGKEESFVPHLVVRFQSDTDLREELGIPKNSRVFGRHGGADTFNIPFARKVVAEHARNRPDDHFVFLNTQPISGTQGLANVHYLPATVDPTKKAKFLATCDAMIHARDTGETFGLAVAEFAVLGKRVFTCAGSREKAHLEMLGSAGKMYQGPDDLRAAMEEFMPRQRFDSGYESFADPKVVMQIFQRKFLH
jgi:hypothetical protein